jgi:large subunit ribosomal protein L5
MAHVTPIKERIRLAYEAMKDAYRYKNIMMAPRIEKVLVSVGTGRMTRADKKRNEFVVDRLGKITGQKPSGRPAKKSIASFKLREGEIVGQLVTLRGERMYGFLDKLFGIALPRTKDFRGFSKRSVDDLGNLTLGVKEHTIFPETADEDLKDVFGLAVTIVTNKRNRKEATEFFERIGVPFRTQEIENEGKKKRGKKNEKKA